MSYLLMKDVEFGGRAVKWPAVPWLEIWVGGRNSVLNFMENMLNSQGFKAVLVYKKDSLSVYISK